ncbi:unnamed protein product [[Candida] boidinii]|nr:unnamed protein product [[Candida] boidinii]
MLAISSKEVPLGAAAGTMVAKLPFKIVVKMVEAIVTPRVEPVDLKAYWIDVVDACCATGTAAISASKVTVIIAPNELLESTSIKYCSIVVGDVVKPKGKVLAIKINIPKNPINIYKFVKV